MSGPIVEGSLRFSFPDEWKATKYDEWVYYRRSMMRTDAKGVDIAAVGMDRTLHLIEVKDYNHPESEQIPLSDLPQTVAAKCRDTLGGMMAARLNATDNSESSFAKSACTSLRLAITLHIELPNKGGRLTDKSRIIANLRTKLRSKVKGMDPHAEVRSRHRGEMDWSVEIVPFSQETSSDSPITPAGIDT